MSVARTGGAKDADAKDEVDVSILANGKVRRAYSRSCKVDAGHVAALPDASRLEQRGCTSTMARIKADDGRTVEAWTLPNGVVIEASSKGKDTKATLAAFRQTIVRPLIDAGIAPLDRSKTEIGTSC